MISLLGSVLEIIETLRYFVRRWVLIWVNCLEDILITHFFLSVMLVALCATYFFLISFRICPYLSLCQIKRFLIQILVNLFTRWNPSGVINSKILSFICPTHSIVSYSGSPLYSLNKYIANILKT